ncbi:MAG TPA: hypothetical protein VFO77_13080 [Actinoplanes sp.]|nr:hypothetical protein [Actinoplanes sp.]
MVSSASWPPRRLPSRTRLLRIRFHRLRATVLQPLARRLTLWISWLTVSAIAFLAIDRYT